MFDKPVSIHGEVRFVGTLTHIVDLDADEKKPHFGIMIGRDLLTDIERNDPDGIFIGGYISRAGEIKLTGLLAISGLSPLPIEIRSLYKLEYKFQKRVMRFHYSDIHQDVVVKGSKKNTASFLKGLNNLTGDLHSIMDLKKIMETNDAIAIGRDLQGKRLEEIVDFLEEHDRVYVLKPSPIPSFHPYRLTFKPRVGILLSDDQSDRFFS